MQSQEIYWMSAFNLACPAIYNKKVTGAIKPEFNNVIVDKERMDMTGIYYMSDEQRKELKKAIKPYLATEYFNSEIYRKLKAVWVLTRDNGTEFTMQAITPYIREARIEFNILKPKKPETKAETVIELYKKGFKRKDIIKMTGIHRRSVDLIKKRAVDKGILPKVRSA